MKENINIDTKTFVRFWLVVIGFALTAFIIYSSRVALLIIGIAFFLAIALSTPVNRLAKILPGKSRVLSTAIAYVAVVLILGLIVFLVIPPILEQTAKFIQNAPSLIETTADQSKGVGEFINKYKLQPEVDKVILSFKDGATRFASSIGSVLVTSISSLVSAITAFILVLVLAFFMLVEGPSWLNRLWKTYKNKDLMEHHRNLMGKMYLTVTSYVTGQLTVSAIAGAVAGVVVFILSLLLDIPASLAIPTTATVFLSSLVPLFGAMVGAIIVSLVLALNNITSAIIFLVFFILYQQIESNYISPKIQSKRIDLSILAILVSVTIGIYLFGIIGGIISIPVAGSIKVLAEDYFARVH